MNSLEIFKQLCGGLKFPKETNPTLYAKVMYILLLRIITIQNLYLHLLCRSQLSTSFSNKSPFQKSVTEDDKKVIKKEIEEVDSSAKLENSNDSEDDITILNSFNMKKEKRGKKRKLQSEDEIKRKKQAFEIGEMNHYRNVNKIKVKGKSIPAPAQTFDEFKIDSDIQENLRKAGFTMPTLIQQQAVPVMMQVSCIYSSLCMLRFQFGFRLFDNFCLR